MASTIEEKPNGLDADASATPSCLNDPNYAIICVFLQKFAGQLKIEHPDFLQLQKMIENADDGRLLFFVRKQFVALYISVYIYVTIDGQRGLFWICRIAREGESQFDTITTIT